MSRAMVKPLCCICADFLPMMLVRRSDIEILLQTPDKGVADASRAVEMLEKSAEPGTFSSIRGRAYLTLGRALQAQNKRDEARAALQTAFEHLQSTMGTNHSDTLSAREWLAKLDSQPR